MEKEKYQELYDDFMSSYNTGSINPEQVGEIIARLAGYYTNYNLNSVREERLYSIISKENILQNDEQTGKPISAAKAEILSAASSEAYNFKIAKAHVSNLETLIGSLKFLQRGLLQEYNQSILS